MKTLEKIYLDWVNNYLSTEKFASDYEIDQDIAVKLIDILKENFERKGTK